MLRKETINELFFPVGEEQWNGVTYIAPPEALELRDHLEETWLAEHPVLPFEIPMVSLGPTQAENGQEGYYVRTVIVYKAQPDPEPSL